MNKRDVKGSVPALKEREMVGEHLNFAASEAYMLLRTNLMYALPNEKKCRVIGLTSAVRGEGKSTTAINLGCSLAQTGNRVLIIEADMRLPVIAKRLGLEGGAQGLSNLLAGLNSEAEVLRPSGLHESLWVIASGNIPPNPSELLNSNRMGTAIEQLGQQFDFILLDLPPVNAVSDALVAAKLTDGMLMVVRQNYSDRRSLSKAVQQLRRIDAKLLGFVMTNSDEVKSRCSKKYGSNYGYGKSRDNGHENP